jgi:hypothetical protein
MINAKLSILYVLRIDVGFKTVKKVSMKINLDPKIVFFRHKISERKIQNH